MKIDARLIVRLYPRWWRERYGEEQGEESEREKAPKGGRTHQRISCGSKLKMTGSTSSVNPCSAEVAASAHVQRAYLGVA